MGKIIICRAAEVEKLIFENRNISAVLSIEHPGAVEGAVGYAPRLLGKEQKILTFWDAEDDSVAGAPELGQVKEGISFALEHLSKGDVIIHCNAGKSRSTALALGVLACLYPEKDPKDLVEELLEIRPMCAPNIVVVRMADDIAGRDGRLLLAVLSDSGICERRGIATERRAEILEKRPELLPRLYPGKFKK